MSSPRLKKRKLNTSPMSKFEDILSQVEKGRIDFNFLNKKEEDQFWYEVLYAIGSHMSESLSQKTEDPLTLIFCGYWILYQTYIYNKK